ncbi:aldo/keto reductase [bacterium]|nr:aldo/keto reductase [bacterium]
MEANSGAAARARRIRLGHSDAEISRVGLGCMGMSEFYGPSDEAESIKVLQGALDVGVNFFDTADMYGSGHNEELLGRAFAGRWHELVLATKFAVERGPDGAFTGINNKPEYIHSACEASLKRLGRDNLDLYYMHRRDPAVPLSESIGAMKELVEQGKVRWIGISEVSPQELREAFAIHPISAVQNEFSMWSREPLDGMLETAGELGTTFVAYSPLGRGFLTGAIKDKDALDPSDFRLHNPRFSDEALEQNRSFLEVIAQVAQEHGVSSPQVALAWVLNQSPNLAVIPGTRKLSRLQENIAAGEISFSAEQLQGITAGLPEQTAGTRY